MFSAYVARAAQAILCRKTEVTDLYKGDCRGCGECRHFKLDAERTRLRREVFGEHAAPAHYCGKLHIFVSILDSP